MRDYTTTFRIVDRLFTLGSIDRAEALLATCLARDPGNPGLLRRMGRLRLAQGRASEAVPMLEQAVAHDRIMRPLKALSRKR